MKMRVKYEYDGSETVEYNNKIFQAYWMDPTTEEQRQKHKLLKVKNLSIECFEQIIEENKFTLQDIKNSSVSYGGSIPQYLITFEMFPHLEYLVKKFGREILDYSSIVDSSATYGYIPAVSSVWDLAFDQHSDKENFQEIMQKLIDLNANVNLCSNYQEPQNEHTILDRILSQINYTYDERDIQKFKSIARLLLDHNAESANGFDENGEKILSSLRIKVKSANKQL